MIRKCSWSPYTPPKKMGLVGLLISSNGNCPNLSSPQESTQGLAQRAKGGEGPWHQVWPLHPDSTSDLELIRAGSQIFWSDSGARTWKVVNQKFAEAHRNMLQPSAIFKSFLKIMKIQISVIGHLYISWDEQCRIYVGNSKAAAKHSCQSHLIYFNRPVGPWLQGQESVYQSDILEIVTSSSTSVSLSKKHRSVSPHYCSSAVLSGSELSRGLSISIQTATVDGQQGDYLGILSTFRSSRRSYTAGHAAEAHIEFCD